MKRFCRRTIPILLLILALLPTGGCTKKIRLKWNLRAANRDFAAENYDAAEVEYKKVLRLERFNPVAIGQLGRIYVKEGRIMDARIFLAKANELTPNSLPVQMAFGQVALALRDYTNSANVAWRILSFQPTNEEALILLIDSHGSAAEVEQKVDVLPHIKENPAYHTAMAVLAMRQMETDRAENEIQQALKANPNSSETYFVLADLRARKKDEKAAVEALKKAADLSPMRSGLRIKYADFLIRNNNGAEARKALQLIVDKAPDYIPAWIGLMNLSMAEKKFAEATRYADTIVDRDEHNYDGLLGRGTTRLAQGDADGAIVHLEHMNALFPKSPQGRYELASAYLQAHNRPKCIENLNRALEIAPDYTQPAILLAQLDIQSGDAKDAVKLLTAFVQRSPKSVAEIYLLLADADVIVNKPDDALTIYSYMAKILPTNEKIPFLTGIVLGEQHKNTAARAAFQKALELKPDFVLAAEQLINVNLADHRFTDAEKVAQAQIEKSPQAPEAWELMAKVDFAETNLPHAETSLAKAIQLNPKLAIPYIMLAHVYASGGKYPDALKELDSAAAQTNNISVYLQIGELNDQIKNYDASRDAYEKALTVNSNSIQALNNLSYIYAERLHEFDKAYALAERARLLLPNNPNIGDTVGWILFRKGEYARALPLLQDCADKLPDDPEIQYHMGMAHYMLDHEDAARAALQKAVASPKSFTGKDEAKSRLAILDINSKTAGPDALAELEKALKERPDDPVVLDRIGLQQEKAGQWEKAETTYETTLKQHPDAVPIMSKLAWLYTFQTHNPERATELSKQAHKLSLEDPLASAVLGHWLFRSHDFSRALSLLESASERLPNQPEVLQDLAWAYYSLGRVSDAQATMQKAVQNGAASSDNGDPKQFLALADCFAAPAKAEAAASKAQQILKSDPAYVPALMISGVEQERAGNFQAAQETYGKALEVFPQFAPAQRQLAIVDARHFPGDAKGFTFGEKAHAAYPDDAELGRSLGILSFYQAKYPRSMELLQESTANNHDDGEIYYYLGMDYFQLKRSKDSRQNLERALALKLPDNLAADAKKTLASLK